MVSRPFISSHRLLSTHIPSFLTDSKRSWTLILWKRNGSAIKQILPPFLKLAPSSSTSLSSHCRRCLSVTSRYMQPLTTAIRAIWSLSTLPIHRSHLAGNRDGIQHSPLYSVRPGFRPKDSLSVSLGGSHLCFLMRLSARNFVLLWVKNKGIPFVGQKTSTLLPAGFRSRLFLFNDLGNFEYPLKAKDSFLPIWFEIERGN